jgi:hypothetical protein
VVLRLTGNKGEWSELYAFFKLLADGRLYAADENTNKICDLYYDILKVIRKQTDGKWEYVLNGSVRVIEESTGIEVINIPIKEFKEHAELLFLDLKNKQIRSGAFEVPEAWNFAKKVRCNTIKARSTDKSDITLMVHDMNTGSKPTLGFSIKSRIGGASTLLNASTATNFTYKLGEHELTDEEIITFNNYKYFRDKFAYLDSLGVTVDYYKIDSNSFYYNLKLVDSHLPTIMADITEDFYRGNGISVEVLSKIPTKRNIDDIDQEDTLSYYSYKIKELLTNIALGMVPSTKWTGKYETTGGYIIVKEDGDVLCYHIHNRNEFREYLFKNTKLDTPSKKRHKFGTIEKTENGQILKLNLQIRFIK